MHVHTVYLGWGWGGRGRDSSKLKHRGQYRAASTLGFLVAVVVAESRPVCSHWVPILQSCLGGLPGASELCQRDLWLSMLRLLRQKVRDNGQEMGWFVGSCVARK